jgi:hypothetical protein
LKYFGPAILVSISADVRHLDLLTITGYSGKKYGMTRPHLIAKLILVAIGIRVLMYFLGGIVSIAVTLRQNCPPETLTIRMFIVAAKLITTLALSLILLFRSDWLVRIIAGPDADECEKISSRWIIAGFRMTACLCGLLIIYPRMERFLYYAYIIINGPNILSYFTLEGQTSQFSAKTLAAILVEIIKWIFAIYLIFGAPHYVRWQVRSTEANQGVKI